MAYMYCYFIDLFIYTLFHFHNFFNIEYFLIIYKMTNISIRKFSIYKLEIKYIKFYIANIVK